MGWNGNYFSRPTFGCDDFFESVHLGNHEAVMQENVIVVTAGKFAWNDILSSMPVGHLLGQILLGVKEVASKKSSVWKEMSLISVFKCVSSRGQKVLELKNHLSKIYNAQPLSAWKCHHNWIFYDFGIVVKSLLNFCNQSSLS